MMMVRRSWLMIALVSAVLLALPLTAQGGKPSKFDVDLQNQINALQDEVANIELTPGPQGPQGPQGPPGAQGAKGDPGPPPNYTVVHGHSGHVFNMTNCIVVPLGSGLAIGQAPTTENWVSFSIPISQYPVYQIMLKCLAGDHITVDKVDIWDGDISVGSFALPSNVGNNTPVYVPLPQPRVFTFGLGLSVHFKAGAAGAPNALQYTVSFAAAGALFASP